jgi:Zinc carboxypeptidase
MAYMTSKAIEDSLTALADAFPTLCTKIPLPNAAVSGATNINYSFLRIGKHAVAMPRVALIVAGMHARELAQPDAAISFCLKLLTAYGKQTPPTKTHTPFTVDAFRDSTGRTFGPVTVPASDVVAILENMILLVLPLANPAGRDFVLAAPANKDWRKNRSIPDPTNPQTIGVDINRNFDIAWDLDTYYDAAGAADNARQKVPADDTFKGVGKPLQVGGPLQVVQEAESKNIKRILETFEVNFSLDMHSSEGAIMFPWAIEQNSIAKPGQSAAELSAQEKQNFHNPDFDKKRDGVTGTVYREFFPNNPPQRLLDSHKRIAGIMRDAIKSATGRIYKVDNTSQIVGTAVGSMTDFIFAQQFLPPKLREIHAFAVEFGFDHPDGFQPDPTKPDGYPKIEREIHAAMISFVRYIAVQHNFVAGSFASTNPGTTGASVGNALTAGGDRCFFTSAVDDLGRHGPYLESIRRWRDAMMAGARTRPLMRIADRAYRVSSAIAAGPIRSHAWARFLVRECLLKPVAILAARTTGSGRNGG